MLWWKMLWASVLHWKSQPGPQHPYLWVWPSPLMATFSASNHFILSRDPKTLVGYSPRKGRSRKGRICSGCCSWGTGGKTPVIMPLTVLFASRKQNNHFLSPATFQPDGAHSCLCRNALGSPPAGCSGSPELSEVGQLSRLPGGDAWPRVSPGQTEWGWRSWNSHRTGLKSTTIPQAAKTGPVGLEHCLG